MWYAKNPKIIPTKILPKVIKRRSPVVKSRSTSTTSVVRKLRYTTLSLRRVGTLIFTPQIPLIDRRLWDNTPSVTEAVDSAKKARSVDVVSRVLFRMSNSGTSTHTVLSLHTISVRSVTFSESFVSTRTTRVGPHPSRKGSRTIAITIKLIIFATS